MVVLILGYALKKFALSLLLELWTVYKFTREVMNGGVFKLAMGLFSYWLAYLSLSIT